MILQVDGKGEREEKQGNDGSLPGDETLHLAHPWARGTNLPDHTILPHSMGHAERAGGTKGILKIRTRNNLAMNHPC